MADKLPVHGFVLAGGKSSRMGADKALLEVGGVPMVQMAVEKLRSFCAEVSIAGNRDDLAAYAEVVHETRIDAGPAAGIEAGLQAAREPWALFVPVDVPLVPPELLRRWAEEVLCMENTGLAVSHLAAAGDQATFCMIRSDCVERFSEVLDDGERRLTRIFEVLSRAEGISWVHDAGELCGHPETAVLERWFMNVNTPEDLAEVERAAIGDT